MDWGEILGCFSLNMCLLWAAWMQSITCVLSHWGNSAVVREGRAWLLHFLSQLKEKLAELEECTLCWFVENKALSCERMCTSCGEFVSVCMHIFCWSETYAKRKVVKLTDNINTTKDCCSMLEYYLTGIMKHLGHHGRIAETWLERNG